MKKKSIKKEHLLLAGAGGLALIYLLSKDAGGQPAGFGAGGFGDAPGMESITTETITIPAGGEEIGGSILLPPPDPGTFFKAPGWIKPSPVYTEYKYGAPYTKKELMVKKPEQFYGVGAEISGLTKTQKELYTKMSMSGLMMSGFYPSDKPKTKTKKETVTATEKPSSYYEQIPGSGFVVGAKRLWSFLGDTFF